MTWLRNHPLYYIVRIITEPQGTSSFARFYLPLESVLNTGVHDVVVSADISLREDTHSKCVAVPQVVIWDIIHHHNHLPGVPYLPAGNTMNSGGSPPCLASRHGCLIHAWPNVLGIIYYNSRCDDGLADGQLLISIVFYGQQELDTVVQGSISLLPLNKIIPTSDFIPSGEAAS